MKELIGFWIAVAVLVSTVAWASTAECKWCGEPCFSSKGCLRGCSCVFPGPGMGVCVPNSVSEGVER